MKYKVILYNTGSSLSVDEMANFTFYVFENAHQCCLAWVALNSGYRARLWDGETFRFYQP